MNRRPAHAALAATLILSGLALASPGHAATAASNLTHGASLVPAEFAANALGIGAGFVSGTPPRYESVRYRPRTRGGRYGRGPMYASPVQIHLGFFNPNATGADAFDAGFRAGPQVDPRLQLGIGVDWIHKASSESEVISESTGPGGTPITTRRQLSQSSSDLVPVMAFLQMGADDRMPVIPYFGIAGGYQVMFLSATDFTTRERFDATYGGWAWQAWGGAAIPLSGQARLLGEVFVNNGEASRDVEDIFGTTFHETVDLDGVGMRFGVSWGF